ncbi:hypothetical protein KSP39_PZI002321 [Platanthera zijinensis]|uniref:Uncharacterized protein n=1 Tax=Platanthera zijinensis TaxID=2320716 RepID=A0AAP0BZC5_9ASPA
MAYSNQSKVEWKGTLGNGGMSDAQIAEALGDPTLPTEIINAEDLLAVTAYLVHGSRNFLRNVCLSFPLRHGQLRKAINAVLQRLSK